MSDASFRGPDQGAPRPSSEPLRLAPAALHDWVCRLFEAAGSAPEEARLAADHLVGANLAGHDSHGVGMIPRYVRSLHAGELRLNRRIEVVADHGSMLVLEGGRGLGQSVAHQAMTLAIERARTQGLVMLGLRNAHHIGRVGHWAEMAVDAGLASVHFVNAVTPPRVAPYGGRDARIATNPFTVGIPRRDRPPLLLDWATSAIAQGKVRVAYNRGEAVPPGSLIDADGRPTDDPAAMFEPPLGALLPMAGYKGFGLAVINELLSGALLGGETLNGVHPIPRQGVWNNMLVIVFDPARMGDAQAFEGEAARYEDWLRSSRPSVGSDRVRMPGEPEREARAARATGIPIDAQTVIQLDEAARSVDAALASLAAIAAATDQDAPANGSGDDGTPCIR